MNQDLTLLIVTFTAMALTILIMFLPTIFELRKPHDAGPRQIGEPEPKIHSPDQKTIQVKKQKLMVNRISTNNFLTFLSLKSKTF
jgi:hypothetical protein